MSAPDPARAQCENSTLRRFGGAFKATKNLAKESWMAPISEDALLGSAKLERAQDDYKEYGKSSVAPAARRLNGTFPCGSGTSDVGSDYSKKGLESLCLVIPMLALRRRSPIRFARIRHFCGSAVPGLFHPVDHRDVMRILAIALLFCALGGCITPQERTAVYNPAELVPYSRTGTGKITGQAFLKTVGGDVKYAAGNAVWIHPVTSLTTEWFSKVIVQGIPLVAGNPHTDDYRRSTVADAEGRFEFDNLPPGDYYVTCAINWGVPSEFGIEPTGGNCIRNGHGPQRRDSQGYCDALVGQYTVSVHAPKPQFSLVKSLAQHWLL